MKKRIILCTAIAAFVGLMTSCSDDDMLSNAPSLSPLPSNTIAFSTCSNALVSTRSGVTINTLDKFTVDAVTDENKSYFTSVEYAYNNSLQAFQSTTPYYWPTTGTLSFYAISNPGSKSLDVTNAPIYKYSGWTAEKDLVAATVKAGEKEIPYPLTFQHVLSQVSILAEAKDKTEELTYKLTSVTMTTPCDGSYHFAEATGGMGTWDIDESSSKEYSFAEGLPRSFKQNGQIELTTCYWNILPVKTGKIKFKVCYEVYQNGKIIAEFSGDKAKECEVSAPNLVSGKRYLYNLQLSRGTDDAITFTTTMQDWDENNTVSNETPMQFVKVTVNPCGNGSFSCGYPLDFTDVEGVKAYMVTSEKSTGVDITEIKKVPANTGFFVFGDPGVYTVPVLEGKPDDASANLLNATIIPYTVQESDNIYCLSKTDGLLHPVISGAVIGVGKAFLRSDYHFNEGEQTFNKQ